MDQLSHPGEPKGVEYTIMVVLALIIVLSGSGKLMLGGIVAAVLYTIYKTTKKNA